MSKKYFHEELSSVTTSSLYIYCIYIYIFQQYSTGFNNDVSTNLLYIGFKGRGVYLHAFLNNS